MEINEEDWCIDCSDDEKYENNSKVLEEWSLKPDDLLDVINKLECNNHILELEWKCPGRRALSPVPSNNHQQDHLPEFNDLLIPDEKDDFDFMDEMSSPRLPVRRVGEVTPKGSAKKKTASFNGVKTTLLRNLRLEQQEINLNPKKNEANSPGMKHQQHTI